MQWYRPVAPRPALDRVLACAWSAQPTGRHRLVPDACIDVLRLSTGEVWICGPEVRAWTFELPPGVTATGVRFRPGVGPLALGVDGRDLASRLVRWGDVLGSAAERALSAQISRAIGDEAREVAFQDAVGALIDGRDLPNPLAEAVLAEVARSPRARAGDIARRVGFAPRQLHRRSQSWFGYGVATLARIVRFHRFWCLWDAAPPSTTLGLLAHEAGYADQAHLARDCRAITGTTPRQFFAESFATFPDMSDPYKTQASPSS